MSKGTIWSWHAAAHQLLADAPGLAEIVTVLTVPAPPAARQPWLLTAYERLDAMRSRRDGANALAPIDVRTLPASTVLSSEAAVSGFDLDVLLWLGPGAAPAGLRRYARFGVWWLSAGGAGTPADAPPFFWELYERADVLIAELLALGPDADDDAPPTVLYESSSTRSPRSLYRSRNPALWKAAHFPLRAVREIRVRQARTLADLHKRAASAAPTRSSRAVPRTASVLRLGGRIVAESVRASLRAFLVRGHWYVALNDLSAGPSLLDGAKGSRAVHSTPGRTIADPFLFSRDGRRFLFFEEQPDASDRAHLSRIELLPDGRQTDPRIVVERPYHLSYPFVFSWRDEVYMLPESGEGRVLELLRATSFPDRWETAAMLMEGVTLLDPTLFEYAGRVWLFATERLPGGPHSDEVSLFWADEPCGPWTAHPLNPVVSDVRRARPAGRVFSREGALIRPGQDCSVDYGYGITLNRIDVLSPSDYRESVVGHLAPDPTRGERRTHCYDRDGALEAVDRYVELPRWSR